MFFLREINCLILTILEMAAEESERVPQIDTIIILDRQIDLISPLITQLTYEGLIDEFL